jgi:LysM repeat protein
MSPMRRPLIALALAAMLPLPAMAADVVVKEGETLSEIADRHGLSLERLMKLNGISNPDQVQAGQSLKLPGKSNGASGNQARRNGASVTVQEGDTLSEIADRHGLSMERLMDLNGITNPDLVQVGQTLVVVNSSQTKASTAADPGFRYQPGAREHVVRPGESLSEISSGYNVPLSRLVAINALSNPDSVQAGQRLRLKGEPAAAAPAPVSTITPRPRASSPATAATTTAATTAAAVAAATPRPTPRPTPQSSPSVARASTVTPTATKAPAADPGTAQPDWRTYGPLQVDWANWQPMGGSLVAPTLNGQGLTLYLAINCTARKLNATSQAGDWKTWDDPQADFEQQLVTDLCKSRG